MDALYFSRLTRVDDTWFPWALYLNRMYQELRPGLVMFLDDDDMFCRPDAVETVVEEFKKHGQDALYMWRVWFPNHNQRFPEKCWGQEPELGHVSTIGFAFHTAHKDKGLWDDKRYGDFRVIHRLWEKLPRTVWVDKVLTQIQKAQGFGEAKDLEGEPEYWRGK